MAPVACFGWPLYGGGVFLIGAAVEFAISCDDGRPLNVRGVDVGVGDGSGWPLFNGGGALVGVGTALAASLDSGHLLASTGGSALGVGSGGGWLLTLVGASRSQLGGPSGSCFLWRRVGHWRASYACGPYWRCEAVGVGGGVPFAACIAVERLLALSACGCSGLGLALAAGVNNSVLLALAGSVTFAVCVDRRLALL